MQCPRSILLTMFGLLESVTFAKLKSCRSGRPAAPPWPLATDDALQENSTGTKSPMPSMLPPKFLSGRRRVTGRENRCRPLRPRPTSAAPLIMVRSVQPVRFNCVVPSSSAPVCRTARRIERWPHYKRQPHPLRTALTRRRSGPTDVMGNDGGLCIQALRPPMSSGSRARQYPPTRGGLRRRLIGVGRLQRPHASSKIPLGATNHLDGSVSPTRSAHARRHRRPRGSEHLLAVPPAR